MVKTKEAMIAKWRADLGEKLKAGMTEEQVVSFFGDMFDDVVFMVNRELRDQKNRRGW